MRTVLAILLAACLMPSTAHAGRSFYGWLSGTEVMPERGVELQTWVFETNEKYGMEGIRDSTIWWGPQIGITDQLELSLPIELYWTSDPDKPTFTFRRYGIEARYRLAVPDPLEAPAVVPLVRLAAKRDVSVNNAVRLEADVVVSYDAGIVQLAADVGFVADIASVRHTEVRPAAGVSFRVADDFRVGAEVYSELSMDSKAVSWVAVGPNIAWTHGRFWLSAAFGVGVYHIQTAPRLVWGVAF